MMMSEVLYERMGEHIGHDIVVAEYALGDNRAIECVTCGCVIVDVDRPIMEPGYEQEESDNV